MSHSFRDDELQAEVNKRLSLNMLIQGGAAYSFLSSPNFVRSELDSISKGLARYYCQYAILGQLNYNLGDNLLAFGSPNRCFGLSSKPQKELATFPFFAKHAQRLKRESTRELFRIARRNRLYTIIGFLTLQFYWRTLSLYLWESSRREFLEILAAQAVSEILEIPLDRLDGKIVYKTAFGNLRVARTGLGNAIIKGAAGFGGVEDRQGVMTVVARAWNFSLLMHELVKGSLELIALHGLGRLSDERYRQVCEIADHIEYEAWMLQAGPALWKRFLLVCPEDMGIATAFMYVARWPCHEVERFMFELCETPESARARLEQAVIDS